MGSLGPRWQGGVRSLRDLERGAAFAFGLWLDGKDWSFIRAASMSSRRSCASKGEPAGSRRNWIQLGFGPSSSSGNASRPGHRGCPCHVAELASLQDKGAGLPLQRR